MSPLLAMLIVALLLAVPVAFAAAPSQPLPGQRVDMKVLLIGPSTTDGVYDAWKTELDRAGVPFDSRVGTAQPLTDAKVADYAANRAFYQAVIVVAPDSNLTAADKTVLTKLEETFGIRQFSDQVSPNADHGLTYTGVEGDQGGTTATLTAKGKLAFPYLKGPVPIATGSFGYQSAPLASFTPLLTGPNDSPFLGINVRANGTEEMVNTVPGNQFQSHHQLLRDGILGWVTRGVYLGYSRNYLGLDVDDIFLPDDKWDPVNNVTDYDATIRMDAGDVTDAVELAEPDRPEAEHGLQHGRHRALRWGVRSAARRVQAAEERVPLDQPHARAPEPRLLHRRRTSPARSRATRRSSTRTSVRSQRASTTRPSWSPESTPAWRTPARATRARSTRRVIAAEDERTRAARSRPARTTTASAVRRREARRPRPSPRSP